MTKQILLSLLNCSWQWGILGGLTWLIARRFRRSNNTTHLLWLLFLLSLPILFALNQFIPALSFGSRVPEVTQTQAINISNLYVQDTDLSMLGVSESSMHSQKNIFDKTPFFFKLSMNNLILYVWALGTFLMLIRFAVGLYRINRLRHSATVADVSFQRICSQFARKLKIKRQVTVCYSDKVVSPISFGWLSPHILIQRNLTLEQFELVAAHELAHIQRLDWLTNLFSHVVGSIFFFHPIYHLINRRLVHLRERICDDWVIQLTGARKKYAQCLLDIVRYDDKIIPLALAFNKQSWLESRIDSILKHDRRLEMKIKPKLLVIASALLLTCLPILSMAQLIPLRTVQLSLFTQTSEESKEQVDNSKTIAIEKKQMMEMKDQKEYKKSKSIKVLDPSEFNKSEENRVYSGPQSGEKLPSLQVTHLYDENDGNTFDITAETGGKPQILFLQDNNVAGIKGIANNVQVLSRIIYFLKNNTNASKAEISDQELQIGIVFLLDDSDKLPDWADKFLKDLGTDNIKVCKSPDGREGPGTYGLNRNVSQTILIAKDGKVLHNFAFTQPAFYIDPHVLGSVAQAIEVEPATIEQWLNAPIKMNKKKVDNKEYAAKVSALNAELKELKEEYIALSFTKLREAAISENITKKEAAKQLRKLGITWEEGEQLLKKTKDSSQKMDERQYRNQRQVKVTDPSGVTTPKEKRIFSGPQPGEKLPPLNVIGLVGKSEGKKLNFTKRAGKQPFVLFLQDGDGAGLRGLYHISSMIAKIDAESKQKLHMSVVFLGDEPDSLKQRVRGVAKGIVENTYKDVTFGISAEGREGPGKYGLNRNVSQTILVAKNGKVLYNFAFTQPTVYANPHVLGAIALALGKDLDSIEKLLNKQAVEQARMQPERAGMQRDREREIDRDPSPEENIRRDGDQKENPESRRMEREGERTLSPEALVKRFDKDGDGRLNEAERLTASRALANREGQNREQRRKIEVKNPDEFKKNREKTIFSGPQPVETLPPLKATAINGDVKDKTLDFIAKANKEPLILIFQDETPLGLRGLVHFTRIIAQIAKKSERQFHVQVVFLGDSPEFLLKQASKIVPHVPKNVLLGISHDGREGPGNYGLNRNVAQTVLIAKDGKVLHNFALAQPMLSPDPYVLGGLGELIGQTPATLRKWLNEAPSEGERMGQQKEMSQKAATFRKRLQEMVEKREITIEEARKRFEKEIPSEEKDR